MGHEYCGVVEEIGSDVKTLKRRRLRRRLVRDPKAEVSNGADLYAKR